MIKGLGYVAVMLIIGANGVSAQVRSDNQSGGVTAERIDTLNQNFDRSRPSPYLKDLQQFYAEGGKLARGWMLMPPDLKDEDILGHNKRSTDWVNSAYVWISQHVTVAAAERFVILTPSALTFTLPGAHSAEVETMYSNWRWLMPQYLANLNDLMKSDEMYPPADQSPAIAVSSTPSQLRANPVVNPGVKSQNPK
jgi:hypothetical protein